MANNVGGFTAYSNRLHNYSYRSALWPCGAVSNRSFQQRRKVYPSSFKRHSPGLVSAVLEPPSMTNALHEVPTSRQNRRRNGGKQR